MLKINIDKNQNISIYKQIISQIIAAIDKGILKPGEQLPTERELSSTINIARGTIQKAYYELERKDIIETLKGSGSFVSKRQDILPRDKKEIAIQSIDELLLKLDELDFTPREIKAFIDIRMMEKENNQYKVRIAAIDCNPEALDIFRTQISYMKNIEFRMFIIDEIISYSDPVKVFEDYDIIITTPTHYAQISGILYSLKQRLFKVAVSPARDTIIKIATIPENSSVGMIVKSINFRNIILRHLESLYIDRDKIEHAFETELNIIIRLLKEKDMLIIPQCFSIKNEAFKEALDSFIKRGGKIIEFKYQIERGSLIYIEEQIGAVLRSR
jgi:DNA-binding transcriptional regulator YhcF (GntR family)